MAELNKITMYCNEGGSDKQYTMWMTEKGGKFTVDFNFGPRGGWIKPGTKTKAPVSKEEAQKAYDALLKEKRGKGYRQGEDAPSFSEVEGAVDSGMRPMLLTPDDEEDIEKYFTNPAWGAQIKLNGKRIMLRNSKKEVIGVNKAGLVCPIPKVVESTMAPLAGEFDGELIGDNYHPFDMMNDGKSDTRKTPYSFRHDQLMNRLIGLRDPEAISPVIFAKTEAEKRSLYRTLKAARKEGIVFKMIDSTYHPGRVDNLKKAEAVKIKFYKAISPVVIAWNKTKQSIEVGLHGDLNGKRLPIISVGNVTIPDKYVEQIVVGKPVRVKYLYATSAKQLYQSKLDPTDDGLVMADQVMADPITDLKFEGKEED
jgi:bifunctional non-homologous end joining protein LigD